MVGRASDFGVDVGPATVDMKRVKARKDAIAGQSRTGVETWLETMERCTVLPEAEAHSLPRSRADRERGVSQCGLADARRAEDEEILAVLEEVAGGERLELLLVERGLVAEVERLEPLHEGEPGQRGPHRDVLGGLRPDLLTEKAVEEVGVGELLRGGVLEPGLQPLATLEESQALEVLVEPLELGGRLLPEAEAKRRTSRPRSDAMCPWPEIGR